MRESGDRRWRGWPRTRTRAGDGWVDLSHTLHAELSRISFFPAARFERLMSMPADPLNLTEMQMVCHFGTHVDAPCHFIPDAPSFDEIPFDRLYGPGVVWPLRCKPYEEISPRRLAAARPALRADDILLIDSGWARHVGSARYDQHPSLSLAAAEWLVERRVKLVGVDFATPDLAVNRRAGDFAWPVHHRLLSNGTLIVENLANLRRLSLGRGQRIEVMCLALKIGGADGAPARVIARRVPRGRE